MDSFTVIICQNSSNPNHISESLYKIAESITLEYNTNNIPLNISIGNIVRDIWKLNLSYKSARQALEYRFFFPQKNIFDARGTIYYMIMLYGYLVVCAWILWFPVLLHNNIRTYVSCFQVKFHVSFQLYIMLLQY